MAYVSVEFAKLPVPLVFDRGAGEMDVGHIMRLGGWATLEAVRHTRSVKYEDSLKVYEGVMKG
jgi:hypothetical protein